MPWKTLKFQPTPENLCSEADFPSINIWPCSAATLFIPVTQWRRIYGVIGGKAVYHLSGGKQPHFTTTYTNFQVKCRMKDGWVQAEGLYMIIIFFENIVKNILENSWNLAENPLKNPGKEFHFTVGHPEVWSTLYLHSIGSIATSFDALTAWLSILVFYSWNCYYLFLKYTIIFI